MGIIKLNGITYGIGGGGDANIVEVTKEEYERIEDRDRNGVTYFVKDLEIEGTVIDEELSEVSENPVQNRVIKEALDGKLDSDQLKNEYGIEEDSIQNIQSEIGENSETLGYVKSRNIIYFKSNKDFNVVDNEIKNMSADINRNYIQLQIFTDKRRILSIGMESVGKKEFSFSFDEHETLTNIIHSGNTFNLKFDTNNVEFEAGKNYTLSFDVIGYNASAVGGIIIKNVMLNEGTTALPYEPYHASVDKRLNAAEKFARLMSVLGLTIDLDNVIQTDGCAIDENGAINQVTGFKCSDYIDVDKYNKLNINGFSNEGMFSLRIHGYDSGKNWISQIETKIVYYGDFDIPFDIPDNVRYIRISSRKNIDDMLLYYNVISN